MQNHKCGHKVHFLSAENDDMTHRYHHVSSDHLGLRLVAVYKVWNIMKY